MKKKRMPHFLAAFFDEGAVRKKKCGIFQEGTARKKCGIFHEGTGLKKCGTFHEGTGLKKCGSGLIMAYGIVA
ncbi:MAG: hypothetical protein K6F35_12190 [Lachnospiraceae bacterium]|nr:hypothetical protein [Lachnospiraceae bacterium]